LTVALAAEFAPERAPPAGRALVEAAREAGAGWVVLRVGAALEGVRATGRAAEESGTGLLVFLEDTRGLADLAAALPAAAARKTAENRDRLLVVVESERAGKRLRAEVPWAPSAVDVGAIGGFARLFRSWAPNHVRAMCLADDVLAPAGMFGEARLAALAAKLRLRGARLWLRDVAPQDAERLGDGPVFGLVVSR
jgi:hypothetical protein